MERKLVKSAIYGFLLGLAIMILFVTDVDHALSNPNTTYYLSTSDYIIKIIRYTIIFTFGVMILTLIGFWDKFFNSFRKKEEE